MQAIIIRAGGVGGANASHGTIVRRTSGVARGEPQWGRGSMTGQRVLAVALLITSLFVLGTLSASLGDTVTSTPNDAIDIKEESLPFVGDGASQIADSYESGEQGPERNVGSSDQTGDSTTGGEPEQSDPTGGGGEDGSGGPASGESDRSEAGSSGQSERDGNSGSSGEQESGQGPGTGAGESLWALLWQLLSALLSLLALLAILAAGVVLVRRREQVLARLQALLDRYGPATADDSAGVTVPDGDGDPVTVVERAWNEMIRTSPAEPAASDTPRECARAVVDAGGDPATVDELTSMYERVRYGDGPITPDDARRALAALRTIKLQGEVSARPAPNSVDPTAVGGGPAGNSPTISDGGGPVPSSSIPTGSPAVEEEEP